MFDLYINPSTGDLDYQNGSLSLVRDTNKRVRQELEVTLRAFKGEWFNNTQFGGINRDYIGRVGITKQEVDAWYRRIILSNPEVLELVSFTSSFNRTSRQYDLEFVVRTRKGDESVRVALRPDQEVSYVLPPAQDYLPPTTPSIKTMSAFITGTSDVASIMSKNAISFVSAPLTGTGNITATIERLFQAVTITGTGAITAGNVVKPISATITGSGDIAAYISTVMSATLSATQFNWEPATPAAPNLRVVSNTLQPAVEDYWRQISRVKQSSYDFGGDQYSQIVVSSYTSGNYGLMVRTQPSPSNLTEVGYIGRYVSNTNSFIIQRLSAGPVVTLGTYAAPSLSYPLTLRLEATGSTLKLLVNAVSVIETTDSVFTTGQPGVQASAGSVFVIDDYQAGNIAETTVFTDSFSRADGSLNSTDMSAYMNKVVSTSITGTGSVSASMSKQLSATITASGDVTAGVAFGGMALLTGTSNVAASVAKAMVASISGTDAVTANLARSMSASISGNDSLSASVAKPSSATIAGTGGIVASATKPMSAVMNDAGWIAWPLVLQKVLSSNITNTHNITAAISKGIIAGSITGTSTVSANITKTKYGSATIAGGSDNVSANFNKLKFASATLSGGTNTVTAEALFGSAATSYDLAVTANALQGVYYFPLHEDYQANGGSAYTRPVIDMLRFKGFDAQHGYTTGLPGYYSDTFPATQQTGIVRDSIGRSVTGNLSDVNKSVIHIPSNTDTSGIFSAVCWIRTPATLTNTILLASSPSSPPYSWELGYTSTGRLYLTMRSNGVDTVSSVNYLTCTTTGQQVYVNSDMFIAFSFDNNNIGDRIRLYAGMKSSTSEIIRLTSSTVETGFFTMGNDTSVDQLDIARAFTGKIERVSIHKMMLTESTLTNLFKIGNRTDHDLQVFEKGASSYIRFEGYSDYSYGPFSVGSGFRLSGNGSGTTYSSLELTSGSLGGLSKTAAGTATYQRYPATSVDKKTFNIWVHPTAYPASNSVIMEMHHPLTVEGFGAITLGMTPSGGLWAYVGDEDSVIDFTEVFNTNAHLNLNTTYMITLVYDRTSVTPFRLHVNGSWVSSDNYTNNGWNSSFALPTGSLELFYGSWSKTATNGYAGYLERASTFETALTQQQITELYQSGIVSGYIMS